MIELKRDPNFRPRKNISLQDELDICEKYTSGLSTVEIGKQYNVCHKTIAAILQAYNINRVHNGVRKYSLNEKYFDSIDTQNKAYILGLLYADGYNCPQKGSVRLSLQIEDVDILEKIKLELNYNAPLRYRDCSKHKASNGFYSKDMYVLDIYSTHMCKVLEEYGMVTNKSLTLQYPKCISDDLHSHFLRGYFDGDGSLSSYTNKRGYIQPIVTFTSTEDFCNVALDILRNQTNIGGGIYDASCHNGITKVLSVCGINQCKSVLDWLYYDSNLFLQRKYDKYQNMIMAA